jgi:hypothetical protein
MVRLTLLCLMVAGCYDFSVLDRPPPARRVFLGTTHNGALGPLAEVDRRCTSEAAGAGLHGSFVALLGLKSAFPAPLPLVGMLTDGNRPIILPSGKLVATDATFFGEGQAHLQPINQLASGAMVVPGCAWTNFLPSGKVQVTDCAAWSAGQGPTLGNQGNVGSLTADDWSDTHAVMPCDQLCYVYCLEL